MPTYKLQKNGVFIIKDYNQASPFSNFLPGIAGVWGIPLWAFYLNRGQALSGFGRKDKDGAISEFYPANKAYSLTPLFGFRTFIKDSRNLFYEPFSIKKVSSRITQSMEISSGCLKIIDTNPCFGLQTSVKYFTLANEPVASLIRKVTFKNISSKNLNLKVLDGLARIIPYGTANAFLKDMARTVEAWMQAGFEDNYAFFRLIVDPADTAQTTYIEGANFNYSFYQKKGEKIHPPLIADPEKVFGQNLSYTYPREFALKGFNPLTCQILCGKTPSAFSYLDFALKPNQEIVFYNLFGAAPSTKQIKQLVKKADAGFLDKKEAENTELIEAIKDNAFLLSGQDSFSSYLKSSYLDNVLRGGFPYQPDTGTERKAFPYYVFSRKHGDLERDYNYFNLSPSFFSEGESNYRDLNQNRRMDLFFKPSLGEKNITYFLNLIQADGYNPLVLKGQKLYLSLAAAKKASKLYRIKKKKFFHLMVKGFYLGEFFQMLSQQNSESDREGLVSFILENARRQSQAVCVQGYWIDHWRYSLDLIESFLKFYPDCLDRLFLDTEFTFFDDKYRIKTQPKRYHLRKGRIYQGESIEADKDKAQLIKNRKEFKNLLRSSDNKVYKTNLIEKLLLLILNKAATFDPDGLGIEMEADKPGWCDSLNGLPALFGSSICETFELKRAALLLKDSIANLKNKPQAFPVSKDTYTFFNGLNNLIFALNKNSSGNKDLIYWQKANKLKETFRKNSFFSLSSRKVALNPQKLINFLSVLVEKINKNLPKAKDKKTKLYFTYFTYEATEYKKVNRHLLPLKFKRRNLPLFLEGIVHDLRCRALTYQADKKRSSLSGQSLALHKKVKASPLYDRKLKMYKLNASLSGQPLEIGRSRIFNPGWLENESIWLHMEYKYLLELLKNGLYPEFFKEFKNCAVCFQSPNTYGRSILENSSFLASSAHPDKNIHGKGFVARLTGATVELLDIWIFLSLGPKPFFLNKKQKLVFEPKPILEPDYFIKKSRLVDYLGKKVKIPANTYSFKLFSKTLVVYHNPKRLNTFSSGCRITRIDLKLGAKTLTFKNNLQGEFAQLVRAQKADRIDIYLA